MKIQEYSDLELLEALKSPEELDAAVRFLYVRYFDFLKKYITKNQGTREDAEDIFQDVVVAFIELNRLGKFRKESSIKTFLYALNRNIWLNELKKRGKEQERVMVFEDKQERFETDISFLIGGRESKGHILDIIGRLGEVCRAILLAFYFENLPIKAILSKLNYENEQVVRNKKYKCLKQLEEILVNQPEIAKILKQALRYEQ